ncbi:MAG: HAD-IA family hydrolase [Acidobacteriota bacterium]
MKKPLLIFDLMDTVVVDPFFYLVPSFFGMTMAEFLQVKDPDSWPDFELGKIDEAEYFHNFFRNGTTRQLEDSESFKAALFAAYHYVEGMEALLTLLHKNGAPLWVHSNYSPWVSEIRTRLGLDRFFTGYAMSFELGARKPDPQAYQAALAYIGEIAANCLLIDDRMINVEAARALGMLSIHFQSTPQLHRDLISYGFAI